MVVETRVSLTLESSHKNQTEIKNVALSNQSKLTPKLKKKKNNNLCIESIEKPIHTRKKELNELTSKSSKKQSKTQKSVIESNFSATSTLQQNEKTEMANDSLSNEMTRSFLEKFFNRETNSHTDKTEKNQTDQVENEEEKIKNELEESKNKFIDFIFDFTPSASLNNSIQSVKHTTPRKQSDALANDINSILNYLSNLKPKNKLHSKIVNNYLDLEKTLSDSNVRYYIRKRTDCKCIQNALGCCLESFYESKLDINKVDLALFDKCCEKCSKFEFFHYRLNDNSNSFVSEAKKFETEEPDWYKHLKTINIINDLLNVHDMLRTPNIHEFLVRSKCKCLLVSVNCCIKKIYELFSTKTSETSNLLKEFIEYSCCAECQAQEATIRHLKASIARSIFATKLNSNSSSLDDDVDETKKNNNQQTITQRSEIENTQENSLLNENETKNKSNASFDNEIKIESNESIVKVDQQKVDSNETSQLIDFIFESKRPEKSLNNSTTIYKQVEEEKPPILDENKENSNEEDLNSEKSKDLNLVKSKTSPVLLKKSALKMNNSSTRASNTLRKSKNVTFYDEKRGFVSVPMPDWQEDLREPVYSKAKMPAAEWKIEIPKNEYELTKLKLSMSLNSQDA